MASESLSFGDFVLAPDDRQLRRAGEVIDINGRYLDALILLVTAEGGLVSKDQFMERVWRGVPVTDEALTQCIKTLRRQLGDNALRPAFIETVPKHGYRFIAPVTRITPAAREQQVADVPNTGAVDPAPSDGWRDALMLAGAGTLGAGVSGVLGGLFYGFLGASREASGAAGSASLLLVLLWLCMAVALMGGAGVSFGIAIARRTLSPAWIIAGGALGGLIVGGTVKLLGVDAFRLLLGESPNQITGPLEGLLIGAAVGLAVLLSGRDKSPMALRRGIAWACVIGGGVGIAIPLLGGKMMSGSLEVLGQTFPQSQLRLDQLGLIFGERGLGPVSQVLSGWLEGALFATCIVVAMSLARRKSARYDV